MSQGGPVIAGVLRRKDPIKTSGCAHLCKHLFRIIAFLLIAFVFYSPFGDSWINNPSPGWDAARSSASWATDGWNWDLIDCIYFAMVTMTTVGYGDMPTLRQEMRIFTMVFGFVGVVFVASSISAVADSFSEMGRKKFIGRQRVLLQEAKAATEIVQQMTGAPGAAPAAQAAPAPAGTPPPTLPPSPSLAAGGGSASPLPPLRSADAAAQQSLAPLAPIAPQAAPPSPPPSPPRIVPAPDTAPEPDKNGAALVVQPISPEPIRAGDSPVPVAVQLPGAGGPTTPAKPPKGVALAVSQGDAGEGGGAIGRGVLQLKLPSRKAVCRVAKAFRLTGVFFVLCIVLGEVENAQISDCGFFSGWTCFTPYSCETWKNGEWPNDGPLVQRGSCWTWIDQIYFGVVTFVTIGYGDVSPISKVGKLLAAFLVAFGVFCFTTLLAELVEFKNSQRLGADKTLKQRLEELRDVIAQDDDGTVTPEEYIIFVRGPHSCATPRPPALPCSDVP